MAGTIRESKTILTAEDKTAGAFASFTRNMQQAQGFATGLYGSLAALGGSAVLGGFASLVNKGLEAADAMNKMSQRTGIAVEQLSQLSYAAKLADLSNEGLTKGIKGLSEMMVKANDATSIQAATMKALGIDIKGGVEPALMKLADQMQKLPDGAVKTTLAIDAMGKAGQEAIPFLNMGSDGIRRMKEEADALGLTISGKVAEDAEKFKDNMKAIGTGAEKTAITLATKMAAGLADVSAAMKEAQKESGLLLAAWVGLGGVAAKLFTDDSLSDMEKTQKRMAEVKDELAGVRQRLQDSMDIMGPWGEKLRASLIVAAGKGVAELKALNDELIRLTKAQTADADRKKQIEADKKAEEARIAAIKERFEAEKKAREEARKWNERLAKEDVKGWVAYADFVFAEADQLNKDLAKINEEYWAEADKLRKLDEKGWVAYIDATINEYERELTEAGKQQKSWHQTQIDEWKPFMEGIEGAFRDGFSRMLEGGTGWWKSFTQGLANTFKTTVADFLYQAFAKPLTLQLVASVAGGLGLGGLATAANAASGTGAGLSLLSGGSSLAKMFGFGGGAEQLAGPVETTLLGSIGSGLATLMPWVAGIGAALALIKKFSGGGENPKAMLGFGSGAQAYTTAGVFGAEGFKSIQTDDAFNQSLRAYFASFKAMDEGLAKMLNDSQKQRISAALGSASQYEFAFPKGDGTAGEQLSVAYLKSKYGVVFEELDKTFADFVKNFTGKAEDLQKAIADEAAVLGLLSDTSTELLAKIPGLTIDGLRDMERAGESLADTFQRVVGDFLNAQNALNAAIGSRNPGFARDMVLGQRNSIGTQFAALIGQSYGADLASQMALNPQSFTGLGTEGMSLLAQWLGLQTTLEQLDAQLAGGTSQAVSDFTSTLINSASAMGSAISGLAGYLRGSLLSDLSPLNPQARYNEAKSQFNANLALAQGGNVDAIANFGSLRDQFLTASRAIYASSGQYNTDFFSSYNAGAALTGGAVRPYSAADGNANTAAIVAAVGASAAINAQVLQAIAGVADATIANARDNTAETNSILNAAVLYLQRLVNSNGALTSGSGALA